tara:strand:- start:266 stop:1243 length:978 start_codon:yes stop_codon:yes gene_type:complete
VAAGAYGFILRLLRPQGWFIKLVLLAAGFGVLALGYLGYLDAVRAYLDAPAVTLSFESLSISPYRLLRGLLVLVFFFWLAGFLTSSFESYLQKLSRVGQSNRNILSKIFQIVIYTILFLAVLDVLGISLTALTVFSGAVGIGLGFGLQKVASNFISGLILLFEKSVETDDLVELNDGTIGFVRRTGGRFTLIETFDNRELMVPNEDFITSRVVNWTLTSKQGRVELHVGVAYGSDYELVRKLLLEAANEHALCSTKNVPQCYMDVFADSSVNFILYMWLDDITAGWRGVKSDVMFAIVRKFDEHAITIPFPQRDVHLHSNDRTSQ